MCDQKTVQNSFVQTQNLNLGMVMYEWCHGKTDAIIIGVVGWTITPLWLRSLVGSEMPLLDPVGHLGFEIFALPARPNLQPKLA